MVHASACTEIGEKEEKYLNNKALATIILAILLISTFGALTGSFVSKTKADAVYYTLTIGYAPNPMAGSVVPGINPSVGAHSYTEASVINVTAPLYVSAGTGVRYMFDNWTFYYGPYQNITDGSSTSLEFHITMNQDWTMVAMYHLEYLFTVSTTHTWAGLTLYVWDGAGWLAETQHWFAAGTTGVGAGLNLYENDVAWGHIWVHTGWSGAATGSAGADSDKNITMNGPKTAVANWNEEYYLWTTSTYVPWGDAQPPYYPDNEGYKSNPTDVALSAPQISNEVVGAYRWNFARWEIYRYNESSASFYLDYTTVGAGSYHNITVHVNAFTKAVVIYQLQYYLTVQSSPSPLDVVGSQTGYYDYGSTVPLTAPQTIADPTDPIGTRWNFTWWWIPSTLYTTNRTTTVQILGIYTAYAGYTEQFLVTIKTNPSPILGMANVYFTGQGWYNTGDTATVYAANGTFFTSPAHDTRYVFDEWDFETDGSTSTNPFAFVVTRAWNASALYHKEYFATAICDPVNTSGTVLNTWNGWPIAGYSVWCTENTLHGWGAGSGPVYGYPFYYVFDHWTVVNSSGTFQLPKATSAFNLNFSGPQTTIAHYTGVSSFFTTPLTIMVTEPQYGQPFEVNVTAANLVDLYACDFNVTWNPAYLQLTSAVQKVTDADMWGTTGLVVMNTIDNIHGNYHFVGTQSGYGSVGFNGTHTIVRLTFRIINDPCYITPYYLYSDIHLTGPGLGGIYPLLSDHLGNAMYPVNVYSSGYYMFAVQPTLYMKPSTVTASHYGATFSVEIWIKNITNFDNWYTWINYNNVQLQVTSVTIDTGFLTEPLQTRVYDYTTWPGWVKFDVEQAPSASLANGTGRLATICFKVIQSIFWTTINPILTCSIQFDPSPSNTYISQYHANSPLYQIVRPTDLALGNCVYTYSPIPGDLNMDGLVNSLDLQLVAADYGSHTTYDLNGDANVNLLDIVLVAMNYGRTSP